MNWRNSDFSSIEDNQLHLSNDHYNREYMSIEQQTNKSIQLQKFQDPGKDLARQAIMTVVNHFGDLITDNKMKSLSIDLLSQDCDIFLFTGTGRTPARWGKGQAEFLRLYENVVIQERRVRETFVDTTVSKAIQVCNYRIFYKDENVSDDQVTYEIFSIKDGKISKYIASSAHITPDHGHRDPFERTRKDIMLAKAKSINYALADKPDLIKLASLLDENTEYKIWGWGSKKCVVLNKHNFVEKYKELEENYSVDCVVPYELYIDREFVVGTYVYYLEGKSSLDGKKFIWLSNCVYAFDEHINISKISQQGELYPLENAPPIPFEVCSRETLAQKVDFITRDKNPNLDKFFIGDISFECEMWKFAPS